MRSPASAYRAIAALRALQRFATQAKAGEVTRARVAADDAVDRGGRRLDDIALGWSNTLREPLIDPEAGRRWAAAWGQEGRAQDMRIGALDIARHDEQAARQEWQRAERYLENAVTAHRTTRRDEALRREERSLHDVTDRHLYRTKHRP